MTGSDCRLQPGEILPEYLDQQAAIGLGFFSMACEMGSVREKFGS